MKYLRIIFNLIIGFSIMTLSSCGNNTPSGNQSSMETTEVDTTAAGITKSVFGITSNGDTIYQFNLNNGNGITMNVITYGGIIRTLSVPDKNGKAEDVVLGFDDLKSYESNSAFFGALIGRYGNRIAKGKFTLDGREYHLPLNDGPNSLHGGSKGFNKRVWKGKAFENGRGEGLELTYHSPNMEEGYPGNMDVTVTYFLTKNNKLEVHYEAATDKKTVVNLTQHSYFNLTGDPNQTILNHELRLNADKFIPVDSTLIPTGEIRPVAGTPFDFNISKPIGRDINADNRQLKLAGGYDHCWVLNKNGDSLSLAASLYDPGSGRSLQVYTSEPGVQFYSGNFLDGSLTGKGGIKYQHRTGLALETEHFPDSPNTPKFPSATLNPGEKYSTSTVFEFGTR